ATTETRSLLQLGEAPAPEILTNWFETLTSVQQATPGSPEFYEQTARALVDLIGLDRGLVLLRKAEVWKVVARAARDEAELGREFSTTILRRVVAERRTFYQTAQALPSESLRGVEAVVASPVFDAQAAVAGVLYGSRQRGRGKAFGPLQAQVVQLLASV